MSSEATASNRRVRVAGSLALVLALLLTWAAPAGAAQQHLFDPVLSLTGNCDVSTIDPAPDPGCLGSPPEYPSYRPKAFNGPCGAATDSHGYVYVASTTGTPSGGWIDVFDASGGFVTVIGTEGLQYACRLAVDSQGRVYVSETFSGDIYHFTPKAFPPPAEAEAYGEKELFSNNAANAVAVNPSNDHVYVATGPVAEYTPTGEFLGLYLAGEGAAFTEVWGRNGDVYMTSVDGSNVLIDDGTTHELQEEITVGPLHSAGSIAVDQSNGDFYVQVCPSAHCVVKQYGMKGGSEEFELIGEVGVEQELADSTNERSDLAVDAPCLLASEDPCPGTAGYDSPNAGYVFVDSGATHLYAFAPLTLDAPAIAEQSVSQVTSSTATLRGKVTANGAEAKYSFQYVERESCEADLQASGPGHCFDHGAGAPGATIPAEAAKTPVAAPISGLTPGTSYRFRIVASNHCEPSEPEVLCLTQGEGKPGQEGKDADFATYPQSPPSPACANAALRTGASALLPDCRAYELVTPLSAISPVGWNTSLGIDIAMAAPNRDSVLFGSGVGTLPGFEGNGIFEGFEAVREGPGGWRTRLLSPSGAQTGFPAPGGISPEHEYGVWSARESWGGSLEIPGVGEPEYLRRPGGALDPRPQCSPEGVGGEFELIGCGSIGVDPGARAIWISSGAAHLIVLTGRACFHCVAVQLEPDAAPSDTWAIYDRLPNGALEVVSMKPNGDSFGAGENAFYLGASSDGTAVAFEVAGTTYVRLDNAETIEVGEGIEFAGLSQSGDRLFYRKGGDLFAFDTATGAVAPIGSDGESTFVNVAADGSRAYFSSPVVLTGGEENDEGAKAQSGQPNLYAWDGGTVRFLATLAAADFAGPVNLGKWMFVVETLPSGPAVHRESAFDPSRSTPDGSVLLFESHASLTGHANEGHSAIYRYEAAGGGLVCVSCNPSEAPATADAHLQSLEGAAPLRPGDPVANLTEDGRRAFFESPERLVPRDTDGLSDVYEWMAEGSGGCTRNEGCLALISGGPGASADYLWALTPDGSDVFIRTADKLLGSDEDDGVPSLYDARIGGGFPEESGRGECLGEACQPSAVAPSDPTPASSGYLGAGNPHPGARRRCPAGKRKVRRAGKTRCVKQRKRHSHRSDRHRRAQR
jgi:hypothetical protein